MYLVITLYKIRQYFLFPSTTALARTLTLFSLSSRPSSTIFDRPVIRVSSLMAVSFSESVQLSPETLC